MRSKNPELFKQIETFVDDYRDANGISPSTREIADALGISHPTVSRYLTHMQEKGMIIYDGQRNIQTKKAQMTRHGVSQIPKVGRISCGPANDVVTDILEYIPLPTDVFGAGPLFILEASGDSMINAGIGDGDLVVIRQQEMASTGDIIVPLIDGEMSTLKRYRPRPEDGVVDLIPENEDYDPIEVDLTQHDFRIQGVAINVIKKL